MNPCLCKQSSDKFQSYEDVECYLNQLGMFHMDLGLNRMEKAKKDLGLHLTCPVIHVVGTNGKGSTATFLHSIALAHGFRAGIFTSPHFVTPLERIKMNDRLLPKAAWASLATQAVQAVPDLTYFELLTVMSVMAFMFSEPDVLIYEAGLGAKSDATTAIPADIVVFTPIDLDHTNILGNTIKDIAEDKSYAIREGVKAVITAPQKKEVEEILRKRAKELRIPFYDFSSLSDMPSLVHLMENGKLQYELGLKGKHQFDNAQTALLAWYVLSVQIKRCVETKAFAEGLYNAFIPGRFQQVKRKNDMPCLILDGAHNVHSLTSLVNTLEYEKICPSAVIFSCLKDKEPQKMVALLEDFLVKQKNEIPVIITEIQNNERAMQQDDLIKLFNCKTVQCKDLDEVLDKLPTMIDEKNKDSPVVICGSLFLLPEYFKRFPEKLQLSY